MATLMLLAGCASREPSALDVYREQQEKQAMIQQKQDEVERANRPTQPALILSMIRQAQDQGRWFASLAYIDAYRQQFGDTPEVTRLRADALRLTDQAPAAEEAYRGLLNGPQAGSGWRGLGLLAGARGDYGQAAADLAKAAAAYPTDALVLSDLGYARLRAGDAAGARVPLGQAAELDPANAKVLGNLALLLLREGDNAGAERVMDQAGLTPEVRARVRQLAEEIRVSTAPARVPVAAAGAPVPRAIAAADGGASRPLVRAVDAAGRPVQAPGAASASAANGGPSPSASASADAQSPATAASAAVAAPFGLQPVMDRFGAQAPASQP
ncbi:tetratricopeptide repeat protein [Bordetella sp. N]|uniref:tetratricopeptide repeat protein n=1 Tax=Bordetella sp. N TaxID=1746199 RepID=UPI000AAFC14B|nr:tetratricopeptide repeat protein [Bordetella sp. N]